MSFNDPIADLLTRIRNAKDAKHRYVDINKSRMALSILKVLQEQGYIKNFVANDALRKVRIFLKYVDGRDPVITGLKRASKLGKRLYVGFSDIPRILQGMGISILSTSQGVLDGEEARQKRLGGELLCYVW